MRAFKQLLVGLPATGKTTFLAALWHIVDSEEVSGSLRLEKLHGDREHLNKIRNDWLSCRKIDRTILGNEHLVSMQLTDQERNRLTEVFFPDLAGESFTFQWKDRMWSKEYDQLVCEAGGILLFVHPKIVEPIRIDTVAKIAAEVEMEKSQTASGQNKPQDKPIPWNADDAPTQVQLVELLQFLADRVTTPLPLRVAVIVSAWDLVISYEEKSPEKWLTDRLPLLAQFLKANPEIFERRVYGVSAQGGDLKDADGLLKKHVSSQRIIIVGYNCNQNDLTAPVKWLMS
jgi:hypothetical protein